MNVKFKNGTTLVCTAPTETKLFRASQPYGWLLRLSIISPITSSELDELLTADNISSITFTPDVVIGEDGAAAENKATEFTLSGYEKISSVIVHHGESAPTRTEIQLTKGVDTVENNK